jgi:AmmeMemoRadiSam system protein B
MDSTRRPVVAGQFYDSDPGRLSEQLSGFFEQVKAPSSSVGVVSPHAGYVYSGQTAAWAIASLKSAKTFIVLGPNHNTLGERFSVIKSGSWETPLGKVKIDSDAARLIGERCDFVADDRSAHAMEHSIEVQLPFLQHKFGKGGSGPGFDFVPISIMNIDYSEGLAGRCERLGQAIASLIGSRQAGNVGVVASSDFSHYVPKDTADKHDTKAVKSILELDVKGLFSHLDRIDGSVCGYGPIAVLMAAARALGLKGRLIRKSTSGDVTGDDKSVVAYYAIGFE